MIDRVDLQICAHCVWIYLKNAKANWSHLDSLYSERAYVMQELARLEFQMGQFDERELHRRWNGIDREMAVYDDKAYDRRMISRYLEDLVKRLRGMAYEKKQRPRR